MNKDYEMSFFPARELTALPKFLSGYLRANSRPRKERETRRKGAGEGEEGGGDKHIRRKFLVTALWFLHSVSFCMVD